MTQLKCINYLLCNQFVNLNQCYMFCPECTHYFNRILDIKLNKDNEHNCPICLTDDNDIYFIKQNSCDHCVCLDCMNGIYFDKNYIINMPKNPVFKLKKSWNLFYYGNKSKKIKDLILKAIHFTEIENDIRINNFNTRFIPNIFKLYFKPLVEYQIQKNNYINNYKIEQSKKIKIIKVCAYCRSDSTFSIIFQ